MTSGRLTSPPAPTPTSAEAARRFAEELAGSCAAALGRAVAGVILHGSLTLDDYLPGRSDIDLLVVIDHPPSDARLTALTEAMASRRAPAPGPVDLRLVTRQVAASPTPAPPLEAYLRLTPTSGVRVEERRHPGERDLAVELSVCRAHGHSLLGAVPAELLGEVPDRWVVAAGDAQLADWQAIGDDPPYAELTVLTACRVWRFAEEGCTAPRPRPHSGPWGATPPSGWLVTPCSGATATRPPGSIRRRSPGCWRWCGRGSPRHATAPAGAALLVTLRGCR
jgi:Nucleotidyltransferase domain